MRHVGNNFGTSYGQGKTLAEAAHTKGYWKAPREPYVCRDCRNADGRRHQLHVARLGRRWRKDPFSQTIQAAAAGYVITEPRLMYGQAVSAWIALNRPLEDVTVQRLIRPEGFKQDKRRPRGSGTATPAQYATDRYRGWVFPRTVAVFTGHQYQTDREVWSWHGETCILPDGRVFQNNKAADPSIQNSPTRLLVEMARKLSQGLTWSGPPLGWE